MSSSDRRPDEETKALITVELWQLALIVFVLLFAAAHFLLGVGLPHLGKQALLVLGLLVVLLLLVVLGGRRFRRSSGEDMW